MPYSSEFPVTVIPTISSPSMPTQSSGAAVVGLGIAGILIVLILLGIKIRKKH